MPEALGAPARYLGGLGESFSCLCAPKPLASGPVDTLCLQKLRGARWGFCKHSAFFLSFSFLKKKKRKKRESVGGALPRKGLLAEGTLGVCFAGPSFLKVYFRKPRKPRKARSGGWEGGVSVLRSPGFMSSSRKRKEEGDFILQDRGSGSIGENEGLWGLLLGASPSFGCVRGSCLSELGDRVNESI